MTAKKQDVAKKKVLHIEGGKPNMGAVHKFFHTPEWTVLRLDRDPAFKPDYVGSLQNLSTVPQDSMDGIWINQRLQYLHYHEIIPTLTACFERLKTDGVLMLSLPNITRAAEEVAKDRLETKLFTSGDFEVAAIDMLHGHRSLLQKSGDKVLHRTSFSAHTISGKMNKAGFRNVQIRIENFVLWVAGSKLAEDHPSYKAQPNIIDVSKRKTTLPDELDVKPVIWKPLGLKKVS